MSLKMGSGSRRAKRALCTAVESLERRLQFDSTFVAISPTPFSQNWTDTTLISADDNWSGVPGVNGYTGAVSGSTADVDPQTITADLIAASTPQVLANQTDPGATSTNGTAEFQIANPTVALKGSSSADSPFLLFNVNTTGVSSVQVSYNLRDIDNTSADAVSQVALQYRVGTSGPFTNVPAGYVHDASTGPGIATLVTPVSATLPAAAGNKSQVQVRVIMSNANGTDEWIGVDDIVIKQGAVGAFSFASANPTVNESAASAAITVLRSGGASGPASVQYAASPGTAGVSDFTPVVGMLNFADGQTSATFNVAINNDTLAESAETINLTLSNPTNSATLAAPFTATLTIYDNDGVAPQVLLNEIDVNPPGTDAPFEYVELQGPAGTNLNDVYFVSLEGDPGGQGNADVVVNLTGHSLGSNGLLMIKSTSGGFTSAAATTVVTDAAFDAPALENNANSFAVIYSQTPIALNSDLDPENDGVLNLPPGASLADGIGWLDGGVTGIAYGAILSQPSGTPDAATRIAGNITPRSAAAWYAGDLVNTTSNETLYDTANASANIPAGAMLTPGAPNYANASAAGELGFSKLTYSVSESAGFATITVNRTAGLNGAASIDYAASAGSATAADFTAVSGTLNFADGQTSNSFTVPINDDTLLDPAETINLALTNAIGALAGPRTTATLTIADNDVLLNEIKANPPGGTDNPHEWIEIKATPGTLLNGIFVASVEGDDGSNAGQVTAIYNLSGFNAGSNGLVMIKSPNNTDFTTPAGTTVVNSTTFDADGGALQNGTNSFLVIDSPTNPIALNDDLDTNDDGDLDLPGGAIVLDGIAWKANGATGTIYAPGLTQVSGTPDAATRFANDTDALSAPAFYNADLIDVGNDPTTIAYDPAKSSTNLPVGATLTPGAPNFANRPTIRPTLDSVLFNYDAPTQTIALNFSENVSDHFTTSDFTLVNRTNGNTLIPISDLALVPGAGGNIVVSLKGDLSTTLPDGRYQLRVLHAGVKDAAGNELAQDFVYDFFALTADANHDATVNALDFNALASNFGGAGKTFSQGDFNYDGAVNTDDFTLLAQRFNNKLPAVSSAPIAGAPVAGVSPFASEKIKQGARLTDDVLA